MPFEVKTILEEQEAEEMVGAIHADRRLWLKKDNLTLAEDGDPEAAFFLCPAGKPIKAADAERLGLSLKGGKIVQKKMKKPAANKMAAPPDDKAG